MAIYLLLATAAILALLAVVGVLVGLFRLVRRLAALRDARFTVGPMVARPGESVNAHAHVVPRAGALVVRASLECALIDHRKRDLFRRTLPMTATAERPHDFFATLTIPRVALRSGAVGDEIGNLLSEDARRVLVAWSVVFEVLRGGTVVLTRALPVEVPQGRAVGVDDAGFGAAAGDALRAVRNDLVLSYLVSALAPGGVLGERERAFLRGFVSEAYGLSDPAQADARIDAERTHRTDVDPRLVRRHMTVQSRAAVERVLGAAAQGTSDAGAAGRLSAKLSELGLGARDVREMELEALRAAARKTIVQ